MPDTQTNTLEFWNKRTGLEVRFRMMLDAAKTVDDLTALEAKVFPPTPPPSQ